jgi:hypothetical protein
MTDTFHYWLWFWFSVGMVVYMLKRAYYLVTGPNPIAKSYTQFWQRCWIPLLVRAAVDAGIYWISFYPDLFNYLLKLTPWQAQLHSPIPQFGVVAFFFGMGIDSIVDFAVSKIPWLNSWMPQMPGPLPTLSPTDEEAATLKATPAK